MIRAIDEGAKITISGAVLGKPALRLYLVKGLTDPAQARGKQATAGAAEGGTADLLLYQLKQLGVVPTDVRPTGTTNSKDRVIALENGQVSAADPHRLRRRRR